MKIQIKLLLTTLMLLQVLFSAAFAQDAKTIEGTWDLVIEQEGEELPSWLEIKHSGYNTLVGRFVYAFGSARPISEIKLNDGKFNFSIPRQWEPEGQDMQFEGMMEDDGLKGTMIYTDGKTYDWTAVRAPKLTYVGNPVWGTPIELFNGKDLTGWEALGKNQWIVEDGILKSPKSGANLISEQKFKDFKVHVEFKIPEGSNSGFYLRGRYEVQITDDINKEPASVLFGGIYGFLTPNEMAAKPAGEWQTYDITLIGRRVSIIANGKTIISEQNIPGITGGALDSREGESGSFQIQGDHGPVSFRKITVTPRIE